MRRDEFGHLEHADLFLATKDHLQRVIGVDQSPLLLSEPRRCLGVAWRGKYLSLFRSQQYHEEDLAKKLLMDEDVKKLFQLN